MTSPDAVTTTLGPHVCQVARASGRAYPGGGGLIVRGKDFSVGIDSALGVPVPKVDSFLLSHFHEDHVVGVGKSGIRAQIHPLDLGAVQDWTGFEVASGYSGEEWRASVQGEFDWAPIVSASALEDGCAVDLGGVTIRPIHLPGHTPGHCGFLIEPDGVFFLGDIDLTSFGPYYGDSCSSLADTRATLERAYSIDASVYVTFHQKGPFRGRSHFQQAMNDYRDTINRRSDRLRVLMKELDTRDAGRLVGLGVIYRPGSLPTWGREAEQRMIEAHLAEIGELTLCPGAGND